MRSLNVMDRIGDKIEYIREWFYANHDNPLLWAGIFVVGIAIFKISYNYLNKD